MALGLVLVSALLVQTVVAPAAAVAGVAPDLVVLTVLVLAVREGPATGLRYGFLAGLALDLLGTGETIVGTSALVLLGAGYLAGAARPYLAGSELIGQILVAAIGSGLVVAAGSLLELLLGVDAGDLPATLGDAAIAAGWGALLAPVVALALSRVTGALPEHQTTAGP